MRIKKKFDNVYQFKIILKDTHPPVWRRIQVPETYTFWELHVTIQDAMGWEDYHLHEFRLKNPSTGIEGCIGIPDKEGDFDDDTLAGWEQKITEWFSRRNNKAHYTYDFGDGWEHTVTLEKILPRDKNLKYPICLDGHRACPPEDCGSIPGYEDICQGKHEFQEEYRDYDPEHFEPQEVCFGDPEERLKLRLDFM